MEHPRYPLEKNRVSALSDANAALLWDSTVAPAMCGVMTICPRR